MKYKSGGKRGAKQAWRFIASTVVGEAVDTVVFFTVAFLGVLSLPDMLKVMLGGYLFKVAFEVILTPVSTRFSNWVKQIENIDTIDNPQQTNYNPFAVIP